MKGKKLHDKLKIIFKYEINHTKNKRLGNINGFSRLNARNKALFFRMGFAHSQRLKTELLSRKNQLFFEFPLKKRISPLLLQRTSYTLGLIR